MAIRAATVEFVPDFEPSDKLGDVIPFRVRRSGDSNPT